MSRVLSGLTRAFRAVFACWLAIVLAQPVSVRACPMTGGVLQQIAHGSAAMRHMSEGEHAEHGTPAGHGDHHGGADAPAPMHHAADLAPHEGAPGHDHDRSQCNCIGDCTSMVAFAVPSLGFVVPVPRAVIERRAPVRAEAPVAAEPDYLLPPSTAPPGARA